MRRRAGEHKAPKKGRRFTPMHTHSHHPSAATLKRKKITERTHRRRWERSRPTGAAHATADAYGLCAIFAACSAETYFSL
jgi:hypothetical protein|eukprot:285413-Prymnesium_polylepis.2